MFNYQVLLLRQEFSGALDLISTSQDIIKVSYFLDYCKTHVSYRDWFTLRKSGFKYLEFNNN